MKEKYDVKVYKTLVNKAKVAAESAYAPYSSFRVGAAVYSDTGQVEVKALVDFYMANAKLIRRHLSSLGLKVYGGEHAPYVWIKTPEEKNSWEFFDYLLAKAGIVGTPGSGFGAAGEGYFRLSAFNSRENVEKAMQRILKS